MVYSVFNQPGGPVFAEALAVEILKGGHLPVTTSNVQFLYNWMKAEGGGGNNNPLNTTLREPGSTTFNSAGVQNFTSTDQGIQATLSTLKGYPTVVAALQAGDAQAANDSGALAGDLSKWSGGGYSRLGSVSLPATPAQSETLFKSMFGATSGQSILNIGGDLIPLGGAGLSPTGIGGQVLQSPLAKSVTSGTVLGQLSSLLGDVSTAAFWERLGLFVLGAVLTLLGVSLFVAESKTAQTVGAAALVA
jgi:hypothetical protein